MADHALATVSNPSSALTDFTLVVDLSDMPADWWTANDTSDGTRGRVYKGDGTTRLAADWIDFDDTAETGLLRVLWSGTLASTGTQELWIEPPVSGNASVAASDTYGSDNAYDGGVFFSGNSLTETNRTGSPNISLSTRNGDPTANASVFGFPAIAYDGNDDVISGDDAALTFNPGTDDFTISFNVNSNDVSNEYDGVFGYFGDSIEYIICYFHTSSNWGSGFPTIAVGIRTDVNAREEWWVDRNFMAANTDYRVDIVYDHSVATQSDRVKIYINGVSETLGSKSGGPLDTADINPPGIVLGNTDWGSEYINADVGMFSDRRVVRSADWIDHEYDQTSANATFWSTWSWETGGTGTTYDVGVTDGLSVSDTPAASAVFNVGVADGLAASESPGGVATFEQALSDGLIASDTISGTATFSVAVTDGAIAGDTASTTVQGTFSVAVTDGLVMSDAISAATTFETALSDALVAGDTATATATKLAAVVDGLLASDTPASSVELNVSVADALTASDTIAAITEYAVSVADGIVATDIVREASQIAQGKVSVSFTAKGVSVTFTVAAPGITWGGKTPGISFEEG